MKTIPNLGDQFTQEKIHTEGLQEKGLSDTEMMKKKKNWKRIPIRKAMRNQKGARKTLN